MGIEKANLGREERQEYSKIDLENVDSWLPGKVAGFLAKMIAARNRKQLEESIAASSYAYNLDAQGVTRDDSLEADGDYPRMLRPEPPTLTGSGSSEIDSGEAAFPSEVPRAEETVEDAAGVDDFSGDGIPFF